MWITWKSFLGQGIEVELTGRVLSTKAPGCSAGTDIFRSDQVLNFMGTLVFALIDDFDVFLAKYCFVFFSFDIFLMVIFCHFLCYERANQLGQ